MLKLSVLGLEATLLFQQCSKTWPGHLGLGYTSCHSPQPEHAQIASKAHSVPKLLYEMPCSISPPPSLALQHHCFCTACSCPILPSVSCKNQHLCKAFCSASQPALLLSCLTEYSHPILPSVSCPWPQWQSTDSMFGDFSSRYAAFTTMLSPGPTLLQELTCLSSPPWSADQEHQNIKAFCFLT